MESNIKIFKRNLGYLNHNYHKNDYFILNITPMFNLFSKIMSDGVEVEFDLKMWSYLFYSSRFFITQFVNEEKFILLW